MAFIVRRLNEGGSRAGYRNIARNSAAPAPTQLEGAIGILSDFHLETEKIHRRRHDIEIGDSGFHRRIANQCIAHQHVIGGKLAILAIDTKAGTGIALRIEIDDQDFFADCGKRGRQIDGRRRLADAALLVGNGDYAIFPNMRHPW